MEWKVFKENFDNKTIPVINWINDEYSKIRSGRISPSILYKINVDAYDSMTPIDQLASIQVLDARSLNIKPYDGSIVKSILKAISDANVGGTPQLNGNEIKVSFPPVSEETRKQNVKKCKEIIESGKAKIRNIRQDIQSQYKKLTGISEDIIHHYEDELNKITKEYNTKLDGMFNTKELELMKI